MKATELWTALLISGLVIFPCRIRADTTLETRRRSDVVSFSHRLHATKDPVTARWSAEALSALASVNATNILQPRLASAVLTKGTNGTYALIVLWIEDNPSVSTVEFKCPGVPSAPGTNAILEIDIKTVQIMARAGILYGSKHSWKEEEPELWKYLERISSTNGLSVRLLRGAQPATAWFPVCFHVPGRWISE